MVAGGTRPFYLERLGAVQLMDEVEERMSLPEKQHVASQAVSLHCDTEQRHKSYSW